MKEVQHARKLRLIDSDIFEDRRDLRLMLVDEPDVVGRHTSRDASEDSGVDESVCEPSGEEGEREFGVLARRNVCGSERVGKGGFSLQSGVQLRRHGRRIARYRHLSGEQRGINEPRIIMRGECDETAGPFELLEDWNGELILGEFREIERALNLF